MNIRHAIQILALACCTLAAASCAQEVDETSEQIQEKILKAYINQNYPDAKPSASGLYIVDSIPGTGARPTDKSYVLVDFAITYLDGSYYDYTSEDIAKQLGTFSPARYYRPIYWYMENATPGIKEILSQMRVGGYVRAIIPAILLDEESGDAIYSGEGSTKIYDITLRGLTENIDSTQILELGKSAHDYGITDSVEYGLYFKKLKIKTSDSDTVENGKHSYVRYVGRYLDGRVFDTNVPDTAKKYRLYNSNGSYEALDFQHFEDMNETLENNSFVSGFTKALWRMNYEEHAYALFYYKLGYGEDGSGDIPGYTPLFFELWTQREEDE